MKKLMLMVAYVVCGFAVSAQAETVSYWDPVGKVMKSADATVVTADTATLAGGWYVVKGEVSRAQIEVTANFANLILADGAKLSVKDGADYHPGIKVSSGVTLNIYAQSVDADTMGQLSAHGGYGGAGIGGAGEGGTCGTVNIYGGKLTAVGGEYAAGIGGGGYSGSYKSCGGCAVTVNGGTVKATGSEVGDDFGGGDTADGGSLTIDGGSVLATHDTGNVKSAYGYADPKNASGAKVYRVTVEGLDGLVRLGGLGDYGTVGIVPIDGLLYLWLPNGNYSFNANGKSYTATVSNGPTTAVAQ